MKGIRHAELNSRLTHFWTIKHTSNVSHYITVQHSISQAYKTQVWQAWRSPSRAYKPDEASDGWKTLHSLNSEVFAGRTISLGILVPDQFFVVTKFREIYSSRSAVPPTDHHKPTLPRWRCALVWKTLRHTQQELTQWTSFNTLSRSSDSPGQN